MMMKGHERRITRSQARPSSQHNKTGNAKLSGPVTRSKAALSAPAQAVKRVFSGKRRPTDCNAPPAKRQTTWVQLARRMQVEPENSAEYIPEVIAASLAEPISSEWQELAMDALICVSNEAPMAFIESMIKQQQQAPPEQGFLQHVLRLMQQADSATAWSAHQVFCGTICTAPKHGITATSIALDAVLAQEQAPARHILNTAMNPDVDNETSLVAMCAVASLAGAADTIRSDHPADEPAAKALVHKFHVSVMLQQQGLLRLLEALGRQHHTIITANILINLLKCMRKQVLDDIFSLPRQKGRQLLAAALVQDSARDVLQSDVASVVCELIITAVDESEAEQQQVIRLLLNAVQKQSITAGWLLHVSLLKFGCTPFLSHGHAILQQLACSKALGLQEQLAMSVMELVRQSQQYMDDLVRHRVPLLVKALANCRGKALQVLTMITGYICTIHPEGPTLLRPYAADLLAAVRPERSLFAAKIMLRCLTMIGLTAAASNNRQPLLQLVHELLQFMQMQDDQFATEDFVPGVDVLISELPCLAEAAAVALLMLHKSKRGVAALTEEYTLDMLFQAVEQWGQGAGPAAGIIACLAVVNRKHRHLLLSTPQRVEILHGVQKHLQAMRQPGQQQQPVSDDMRFFTVHCMTEAAAYCGMLPAYTSELVDMCWRVPHLTEKAFQTLKILVDQKLGVPEIAPYARHIACAVNLHVPPTQQLQAAVTQLEDVLQQAVKRLYSRAPVVESSMKHAAVQLAQAYKQYRRWPRTRKLQAAVVLWLRRLDKLAEENQRNQQFLWKARAAEQIDQVLLEQLVRMAAVY